MSSLSPEPKGVGYSSPPSPSAPSNSQNKPTSTETDSAGYTKSDRKHRPELGKLETNLAMGRGSNSDPESQGLRGHDDYDDEENTVRKDYESPVEGVGRRYTEEEEKRVIKKFDTRLVLFMAFLYLLAFLDRSNIGNAAIAGLREDLDISPTQYQWLLSSFYITYILFEWMTLMYRLVPPHIYISLCVLSWGLIASFQSLVTSFGALVFLRALLGIAEAAVSPGIPFYLSFFYKREELAFRTGLVVSAAPLATSFASSLAWLIVKLSSNGPIAPWRSLFLVEGFPSVIVAVFAWFIIPDGPGKARYLTHRERKVAVLRLEQKGAVGSLHGSRKGQFDWLEIGRTLRDPKSYVTAFMFFSCNVAFSSLPVFLPTIINEMGYSALAAQGLSAPPYLLAFVIVLVTAYLSDRSRSRSPYLITHALVSASAYFIIGFTGVFQDHLSPSIQVFIRYICIYPAAWGFFSSITIIIAWTMDNRPAKEGKGTGMAILNFIGQCGPLLGTRLYPEEDGPYYIKGMMVCGISMLVVAVLSFTLRRMLQRENRLLEIKRAPYLATRSQSVADGEVEGLIESSLRTNAPRQQAPEEHFTYII